MNQVMKQKVCGSILGSDFFMVLYETSVSLAVKYWQGNMDDTIFSLEYSLCQTWKVNNSPKYKWYISYFAIIIEGTIAFSSYLTGADWVVTQQSVYLCFPL